MACKSTTPLPRSNKDSLEDCMCTICLCILIQPVTLPCGHELCMPCFEQTLEEASMTCPLCRVRIATWARRAAKSKSLVNQKRWEQIQRLFPSKVQKRLNGQDEDTDDELNEKDEIDTSYRQMVQLSKPGEIRKEYEAELRKLAEQEEEERKREEEASAALIQRLCTVEEQETEETRKQREEQAVKDAKLAEELGRLINEAESDKDTPRLLQEAKGNYPAYHVNVNVNRSNSSTPSFKPSTPQTSDKSQQRTPTPHHHHAKNNTTLTTFFRRLPPSPAALGPRGSSTPGCSGIFTDIDTDGSAGFTDDAGCSSSIPEVNGSGTDIDPRRYRGSVAGGSRSGAATELKRQAEALTSSSSPRPKWERAGSVPRSERWDRPGGAARSETNLHSSPNLHSSSNLPRSPNLPRNVPISEKENLPESASRGSFAVQVQSSSEFYEDVEIGEPYRKHNPLPFPKDGGRDAAYYSSSGALNDPYSQVVEEIEIGETYSYARINGQKRRVVAADLAPSCSKRKRAASAEPSSPRQDGNKTPRQDGNKTPRQDGNRTPRQDGNRTPRQDGNRTPRQDGNRTPRQDSNRTPRQDGNRTPRQDCNKTPRQDGNRTPRQDSNRTPRQDSNRTPRQDSNRTPRQDSNRTSRQDSNRTSRQDGNRRWNVTGQSDPSNRPHSTETVEICTSRSQSFTPVDRSQSIVTVHSDRPGSVVACNELETGEEEEEGLEEREWGQHSRGGDNSSVDANENAPHFKPIHASPQTPPRNAASSGPLEPCVVRITPRILFNTKHLSSTSFPVITASHFASVTSSTTTTNMGLIKSKEAESDTSLAGGSNSPDFDLVRNKRGIADRASNGDVKRAKSASPDVPGSPARLAAAEESRSQYSRRSLREFRMGLARHSPVAELDESLVSSLQNISCSSSRMDLAGITDCVVARSMSAVFKDGQGLGRRDVEDEGGERVASRQSALRGEGRRSKTSVSASGSSVSVLSDSVSLTGREQVLTLPLHPSPPVSVSFTDISTRSSLDSPSPSPRPLGIFNPETVPHWTESLYTEEVQGKGKRLLKKSPNGIISSRNSPKVSSNIKSLALKAESAKADGGVSTQLDLAQPAAESSSGNESENRRKSPSKQLRYDKKTVVSDDQVKTAVEAQQVKTAVEAVQVKLVVSASQIKTAVSSEQVKTAVEPEQVTPQKNQKRKRTGSSAKKSKSPGAKKNVDAEAGGDKKTKIPKMPALADTENTGETLGVSHNTSHCLAKRGGKKMKDGCPKALVGNCAVSADNRDVDKDDDKDDDGETCDQSDSETSYVEQHSDVDAESEKKRVKKSVSQDSDGEDNRLVRRVRARKDARFKSPSSPSNRSPSNRSTSKKVYQPAWKRSAKLKSQLSRKRHLSLASKTNGKSSNKSGLAPQRSIRDWFSPLREGAVPADKHFGQNTAAENSKTRNRKLSAVGRRGRPSKRAKTVIVEFASSSEQSLASLAGSSEPSLSSSAASSASVSPDKLARTRRMSSRLDQYQLSMKLTQFQLECVSEADDPTTTPDPTPKKSVSRKRRFSDSESCEASHKRRPVEPGISRSVPVLTPKKKSVPEGSKSLNDLTPKKLGKSEPEANKNLQDLTLKKLRKSEPDANENLEDSTPKKLRKSRPEASRSLEDSTPKKLKKSAWTDVGSKLNGVDVFDMQGSAVMAVSERSPRSTPKKSKSEQTVSRDVSAKDSAVIKSASAASVISSKQNGGSGKRFTPKKSNQNSTPKKSVQNSSPQKSKSLDTVNKNISAKDRAVIKSGSAPSVISSKQNGGVDKRSTPKKSVQSKKNSIPDTMNRDISANDNPVIKSASAPSVNSVKQNGGSPGKTRRSASASAVKQLEKNPSKNGLSKTRRGGLIVTLFSRNKGIEKPGTSARYLPTTSSVVTKASDNKNTDSPSKTKSDSAVFVKPTQKFNASSSPRARKSASEIQSTKTSDGVRGASARKSVSETNAAKSSDKPRGVCDGPVKSKAGGKIVDSPGKSRKIDAHASTRAKLTHISSASSKQADNDVSSYKNGPKPEAGISSYKNGPKPEAGISSYKNGPKPEAGISSYKNGPKSQQDNVSSYKNVDDSSSKKVPQGDFEVFSEDEDDDDEGLTQEEKDHRLALRLQQQFELADRLKLHTIRFKGSDDEYSLRRKRSTPQKMKDC